MKLDLGNREILPCKGVGLKMERVAKLSPKFRKRILYCFAFICFWWSTGNLSFQASNPKWEMLMFGSKIKACLKWVVWPAKDPDAIWVVDANAWRKLLLAPSLGKTPDFPNPLISSYEYFLIWRVLVLENNGWPVDPTARAEPSLHRHPSLQWSPQLASLAPASQCSRLHAKWSGFFEDFSKLFWILPWGHFERCIVCRVRVMERW